jgi:hypothetical protein
MEDVMGNARECYEWPKRSWNIERQRRGEAARNQGRKQASKQQAIKQAVGVNEESWREDEERLQSVAFGAWPQ